MNAEWGLMMAGVGGWKMLDLQDELAVQSNQWDQWLNGKEWNGV